VTPTTGLKARIAGGAAIIDSARSPITHCRIPPRP
jgi:hypothetical protein